MQGNTIEVPDSGLSCETIDPMIGGWVAKEERVDRVLIPEDRIGRRVKQLAREIYRDYAEEDELYLVAVLKGAADFLKDLKTALWWEICQHDGHGPKLRRDYVKASTYGKGIKSTRESERIVRIDFEPEELEGKNVLLVEDIVDQAFTLSHVRDLIGARNVRSSRTCALLEKRLANPTPEVRELRQKLTLDYVGFRVPECWVAGYGIDAGEDLRELPFIVVVNQAYYESRA